MERLRRLRKSAALRGLLRENHLRADELIWPVFTDETATSPAPVASMPGVFRYPPEAAAEEIARAAELGVKAALLFGVPRRKDETGEAARDPDGAVPRTLRAVKKLAPEVVAIADVCLCEYTPHGHCGLVRDGVVLNDETLPVLAGAAVAYAEAGADIVAPSDMMDGRVAAIRAALDDAGLEDVAVMSYSAKFASAYYGPFRDAAGSAPKFGDRRAYQMDPANAREALREVRADLEEGADLVIAKPAMAYLDVLSAITREFNVPVVAYNVSGEYSMVKAAAANGWIDERRVVLETLLGMKRAGAQAIITYHAREVAKWLAE